MSLNDLLNEKDLKFGSQNKPSCVLCRRDAHKTKGFGKAKDRDRQTYTWQAGQTKSEEVRWIGGKVEFKPKSMKHDKDRHILTL